MSNISLLSVLNFLHLPGFVAENEERFKIICIKVKHASSTLFTRLLKQAYRKTEHLFRIICLIYINSFIFLYMSQKYLKLFLHILFAEQYLLFAKQCLFLHLFEIVFLMKKMTPNETTQPYWI